MLTERLNVIFVREIVDGEEKSITFTFRISVNLIYKKCLKNIKYKYTKG